MHFQGSSRLRANREKKIRHGLLILACRIFPWIFPNFIVWFSTLQIFENSFLLFARKLVTRTDRIKNYVRVIRIECVELQKDLIFL